MPDQTGNTIKINRLTCAFSLRLRSRSRQLILCSALVVGTLLGSTGCAAGQAPSIERVDPPFWWAGMAEPELQLVMHGPGIGSGEVSVKGNQVTVSRVVKTENPNYLFVYLNTANAEAGTVQLEVRVNKKKLRYDYTLKARDDRPKARGLDGSDFIYLAMPDRFANGTNTNDRVPGLRQQTVHRDSLKFRHGGDLKGIRDHLDYIADLGVTALWLNPLLINDQPEESYHGYAATDHYRNDPRIASNEDYREFVDDCHQRGIKVIMDVVYNHVGAHHWLIEDLPRKEWVNNHGKPFTKTSYRAPTLIDPYASEADRTKFTDGWFDTHMPDINQRDPLLADYLIQNSIWWVEYAGIDAYRIDTYAYPDQGFMADLGKALKAAYPNLFLFGETWVHGTPVQAAFAPNTLAQPPLPTYVDGLTDFQLYYALNDAVNNDMSWTGGVSRIYYALAKDYLYRDPASHVLFLDNHDLSRYFSMVKEDLRKYKMGLAWMMTCRGIPSLYYGTEILMKNFTDPNDGMVRQGFPGGWPEDTLNKFDRAQRTAAENEAYDLVKRRAHWRQKTPAVTQGKLMQFVPDNGVYTYFRYTEDQAVMVLMNGQEEARTVALQRFAERTNGYATGKDVVSGESYPVTPTDTLTVPAKTTLILELAR